MCAWGRGGGGEGEGGRRGRGRGGTPFPNEFEEHCTALQKLLCELCLPAHNDHIG